MPTEESGSGSKTKLIMLAVVVVAVVVVVGGIIVTREPGTLPIAALLNVVRKPQTPAEKYENHLNKTKTFLRETKKHLDADPVDLNAAKASHQKAIDELSWIQILAYTHVDDKEFDSVGIQELMIRNMDEIAALDALVSSRTLLSISSSYPNSHPNTDERLREDAFETAVKLLRPIAAAYDKDKTDTTLPQRYRTAIDKQDVLFNAMKTTFSTKRELIARTIKLDKLIKENRELRTKLLPLQ